MPGVSGDVYSVAELDISGLSVGAGDYEFFD